MDTPDEPTAQAERTNREEQRFSRVLRQWTSGLSFSPVFVLITSTVVLILFHENCSSSFFTAHFANFFGPSSFSGLYPAFYWYGCSLLVLGALPFLLGRLVLKGRVPSVPSWGIGLGDWRFGLKTALWLYIAFVPILVAVSFLPNFQLKYPLFDDAKNSVVHFLLHEGAYAVYFIGWEFIFRGFMLFGLRPTFGTYAVFVQMIPFAIMHFGKPQIETLAAVVAGVLLGFLALRARSFWYGWLLHALVAVTNDMLAVIQRPGP